MNRIRKYSKRIAAILIISLCINTYSAVVSDNDGSAFITKSEFDSLKSGFQAQIDNYNMSIDNKIDGAIAAYLAGISIAAKTKQNLILWGGKTVGLVEDPKSHPYVEGRVGGKISINSFVTTGGFISGNSNNDTNITVARSYLSYCCHLMSNEGKDFKYLYADYGTLGSKMIWDLQGYADVEEKVTINFPVLLSSDYTNQGTYNLGLCGGWVSSYGTMGTKIEKRTDKILHICESTCWESSTTEGRGCSQQARYTTGGEISIHNALHIPSKNALFTSSYTKDTNYCYLTDLPPHATYNEVFPSEWYGVNKSSGSEIHTTGDLYDFGWTIPESKGEDNFHIKSYAQHDALYGCDVIAYMRKPKYDGPPTTANRKKGWIQAFKGDGVTGSNHLYYNTKRPELKNCFKSTTGDNCKPDNLYSSELANAIKPYDETLVSNATFNKTSKDIAPLYLGLPIGEYKAGNKVNIELGFLDDVDYRVAFKVGGFENDTVLKETNDQSAGCVIVGETGDEKNEKTISGKKTQSITVEVKKDGLLFFKYGVKEANKGSRIKLPDFVTIEKSE